MAKTLRHTHTQGEINRKTDWVK